jgi:hypothetical protein
VRELEFKNAVRRARSKLWRRLERKLYEVGGAFLLDRPENYAK